MTDYVVQHQPVPAEFAGRLREYAGSLEDGAALRSHLDTDGYVLLRGALDRDEVLAARGEVFERLEEVDEIKPPAIEGIATGTSRRRETARDRKAFWKSVSEGPALRSVSHGPQIRKIMEPLFGGPVRSHDLMYLRPAPVGRATRLHYDHPFFAGNSERIHTAWIPLGDVPVSDGPLVIVEGSNRFADLIDPIYSIDYKSEKSDATVQKAAYEGPNTTETIPFVRQRGARLITTDFHAGDLLVFGMFTLHGSLDNHSPPGRVRLSCDVRYQPAADPDDDARYFGPDPKGSQGGGYGDMKGAKPLTEPWSS